ncbi:MAG: hypothetical protein JWL69_5055 [Phycisphaerales bacterium]|nr:hypothetical protein [Phycisphaerales bacterium]MDB5357535.1 hypothetical protein [Phycisphaerales bacterium]
MRYTWLGALVLGFLPAVASADHGHGGFRGGHHEGFRGGHSHFGFSFGLGIGPAFGYRDYCYGPAYYGGYYAPAYCPPPVVVYDPPVYTPPPVTVYSQPPVYSAPPTYGPPPVYYRSYTVSPAPSQAGGYYYYGR